MTRLDGIRVRELPIPTSVSLSSVISGFNDPWLSNHFLMGVGESATVTASVLDQNGAIMTDLVPMISTTALNLDGIMAFTHLKLPEKQYSLHLTANLPQSYK